MTITTTAIKSVAQGNGATTTWPFNFLIPNQASLVVTLVDIASGNPTVVSPANYSVTGLGAAAGGVVTYPLSGSPLTSATQIVVQRTVSETQQTSFALQGAVYPTDIESGLDYLTMISQQLQDQLSRSIQFSPADTISYSLPVASARANMFLGFDSTGNPIAVTGLTAGTTVSAAMIPVVTAATTAAALTALGIPGSLLDQLIPAGTIWDYAVGGTAPTGFTYPIGQACTSTYPTLRAALVAAGSPYGTNGTDPLMPDLRSVVIAGKSNMGGVDNGLLTGGTVLGAVLGSQSPTYTITVANLPPYTPGGAITNGAISCNFAYGASSVAQYTSATGVNGLYGPTAPTFSQGTSTFAGTAQGGTSTPFTYKTVQPTLICNKIIKVH